MIRLGLLVGILLSVRGWATRGLRLGPALYYNQQLGARFDSPWYHRTEV